MMGCFELNLVEELEFKMSGVVGRFLLWCTCGIWMTDVKWCGRRGRLEGVAQLA